MRRRLLFTGIKWLLAFSILAGLLALAYVVHAQADKDKKEIGKEEKLPGQVTVKAESDIYKVARVQKIRGWSEPVTIYGRVVPNPNNTFELRAAFAGILRKGKDAWPSAGHQVKAGRELARLDLRVDPLVRLEIRNKFNEALTQYQGALESRAILAARLKRFEEAHKKLPKNFPTRDLEDARIQLGEARTKEAAAEAAVFLWAGALTETAPSSPADGSPWMNSLQAPADAEVTEVLAQPGTAVEAGAVIARLTDFRRLRVRLDFPSEALTNGAPRTLEVEAGQQKIPASLVGPASQVGLGTQLAGYFYEVDAVREKIFWRPGLFLRAEMKIPPSLHSASPKAVSVPATALLYHQGRALVYLRLRKDEKTSTFARREVQVLGRSGNNWVLAAGPKITPGAEVVVSNPQLLLSEEFNAAADND